MAQRIRIQNGKMELEGLFHKASSGIGVVITHPHPLYGGSMDSPVVTTLEKTYIKNGYSTLRFNFRGVGGSDGKSEGSGAEKEDLVSAVNFMKKQGLSNIALAGYSFGSWINVHAAREGVQAEHHVMIAPPVAFIPFEKGMRLDGPGLVVTGSLDEYAPENQVLEHVPLWNPDFQCSVISGCDHFFGGFMEQLEKRVDNFLKTSLPSRP